jgi:hypothetical protein
MREAPVQIWTRELSFWLKWISPKVSTLAEPGPRGRLLFVVEWLAVGADLNF